MSGPSELEETLAFHLRSAGVAPPEREYRFHRGRQWRFDFAWPGPMVAVEVEGGTWVAGRHGRGKAFERDCEKYNAAATAGWCVLRFTTDMVSDGRALAAIEKALRGPQ